MKKRKILTALGVVIIAGAAYAFYMWNKPRRDVRDEEGIKITATAIYEAFSTDEAKANTLYLNKAIQVTGEVQEVKKNDAGQTVVYLKTNDPLYGVNCTFKENPGTLANGSTITFKGICTGFLSDVIINEGVIVQ
ncbi:OB-fold protein [Foetidibacter luteolus]|uniref:OB-fold protein n=1 Tax=Foetidibacter luteolus TaxID=2608880 RepID=UPI001A99A0BA|nr:hypothetical protein [Foetidibacter luteolus]